jgi:hypothetical protein
MTASVPPATTGTPPLHELAHDAAKKITDYKGVPAWVGAAIADAVQAAVLPPYREHVLNEAWQALLDNALCNEGTPYDSLSGAMDVVRSLSKSAPKETPDAH